MISKIKKILLDKAYIFPILMGFILIFVAVIYCYPSVDIIKNPPLDMNKFNVYYELAFFSLFFTSCISLLIAWIAFSQLSGIRKLNESKYILEVDERWMRPEILKARVTIHEIYLKVKKDHPSLDPIVDSSTVRDHISNEIYLMKDNIKLADNFVYLLNFLDFMETIGYLYSTGSISLMQINDLFSHSIKFNYDVFKKYIKYKRTRDPGVYKEFQKMYDDLVKYN